MPVSDHSTSETEHYISIESTQIWCGEVSPSNAELLTGDGERTNILGERSGNSFDLDFHKEIKLTFECDCGRRFRKPETARDHLEEVDE